MVREDSDNYRIEYTSESDARTKDTHLPAEFKLGLPVYFGGREVELIALLRHHVDEESGKLSLGVKLKRAERIRQAVFQEVVTDIAERAELVAVYGELAA